MKDQEKFKIQNANNKKILDRYPPSTQDEFRSVLLDFMCSGKIVYPIDSHNLFKAVKQEYQEIEEAKAAMQDLEIIPILSELNDKKAVHLKKRSMGVSEVEFIDDINKEKLLQLNREFYKDRPKSLPQREKNLHHEDKQTKSQKQYSYDALFNMNKELEAILSKPSALQNEFIKRSEQNYDLLSRPTATEAAVIEMFKSKGTKKIEYCDFGTREKCSQMKMGQPCGKFHFKKLIRPHTDPTLGNCSYLDTCRHMEYCKFVHYELEEDASGKVRENNLNNIFINQSEDVPSQWICCDLRVLDLRVLGKFNVVMCDPPWDIHMSLPYGTLKDKEMKALRVDILQDEGLIFLWVTGRAMELGRECLSIWGYKKVEEMIWVKTNQLQRIIRTGRTGHWLNHSKEHCLIGIKGNPKINKVIDCDVLVSEVRETSRKPDEIYSLIERISPGGRKVELFGRPHNTRNGWVTLGNQLPGVYIKDDEMKKRYKEAYPEADISGETMKKNMMDMTDERNVHQIYNNHIQNPAPFRLIKNVNNSN